jgi:hypothetical protein
MASWSWYYGCLVCYYRPITINSEVSRVVLDKTANTLYWCLEWVKAKLSIAVVAKTPSSGRRRSESNNPSTVAVKIYRPRSLDFLYVTLACWAVTSVRFGLGYSWFAGLETLILNTISTTNVIYSMYNQYGRLDMMASSWTSKSIIDYMDRHDMQRRTVCEVPCGTSVKLHTYILPPSLTCSW